MTLKPCPFCGGEAELFTDETGLIEICVECKQCHARTDWSLDWNDRVIPEGYVKVVLCRDCWKWGTDDCPVGDSWDDDDFCCYGEAKEDTNDAV